MKYNVPDHFSYNFELNLDKIPTKQPDRIAFKVLFPGILAAFFLIIIGIYELMSGSRPAEGSELAEKVPFWFNLTFFDFLIIFLGAWIIVKSFLTYFHYKKVFFDGKKITLIYRTPFGAKTTIKESLKKYVGVNFRVEFFQYGFITKNKYIIELYHQDADKIVPLYISTSGRNIRKIWADYAKKLQLNQLMLTDDGLVIRENKNIGKSIETLYKEKVIKDTFNLKKPLPSSIAWVRKADKSIIKSRKIRWDAYNFMFCVGIVLTSLLLLINLKFLFQNTATTLFTCGLLLFIAFLVLRLFTKDKIVIKPNKIIIIHKTFIFSRKKYEVSKEDIEAIDVAFSPVSERNFLAIIGREKTLVFGKKLPAKDLDWIREFLIHDIVKK